MVNANITENVVKSWECTDVNREYKMLHCLVYSIVSIDVLNNVITEMDLLLDT